MEDYGKLARESQNPPMSLTFDAIVVGAGPGGAAAAYWLARAGAAVALLDRAGFPRDKPCGDGLTPGAVAQLRAIGLDEPHGRPYNEVRVHGAEKGDPPLGIWRAGGERHPEGGRVLPRRDLDERLRRHAVAAGAQWFPRLTVTELLTRDGAPTGLLGRDPERTWQLEAPLLIVATGANRSLLPMLGLPAGERPTALALRGYVETTAQLAPALRIFLDPELLPGYGWLFPTGDYSANLGVGVTLPGAPPEGRRRLRAALARLHGRLALEGASLSGQLQSYPLRTDFPALPTHAHGVLLVGETAGLVDPLTGEGIELALASGRLAAEVAAEALAAGAPTAPRLAAYSEGLRARYETFFREAGELLVRLDNPTVLRALLALSKEDPQVVGAIHTAILERRPGEGITRLSAALARSGRAAARTLFALNVYSPWIERCRAHLVERVSQDAPHPAVVALVGRGKMLRALLVFLGCRAAGGEPGQVLSGAAGIELVHAASLVHDDMIDQAEQRRGLPALHRQLGPARALVCGDYLIAKAFRLLAESRQDSPAARVVDAFVVGAESGVRACAGQFQDTGQWGPEELTEAQYYRLIGDKTASIISGALCAGATLAEGGPELLADLARYGECVGLAFQIRDDLLDLEALAQGEAVDQKLSLPLIHAFQHADEAGRAAISAFLAGEAGAGEAVVRLLEAHGSLDYASAAARTLVAEATALAARIPRVGDDLAAFAAYTIERAL